MADLSESTPQEVGLRLRKERKRLKLTQILVCETTSISHGTLSMYESGQRYPSVEFLLKFEELGADLKFVLSGSYSANFLLDHDYERYEARITELRDEEDAVLSEMFKLGSILKGIRAEISDIKTLMLNLKKVDQ